MTLTRRSALIGLPLLFASDRALGQTPGKRARAHRLQLNWFHDPSFAAAYILKAEEGASLEVIEGGPTASAPGILRGGLAQYAIMGCDVFLKSVSEDIGRKRDPELRLLSVDFQRNPVGWIVHPEVGSRLGMSLDRWRSINGIARNLWLFEAISAGSLKMGDKVGTETTAVWLSWRALQKPTSTVGAVPVGFDPAIVLQRPNLAFPVYLNEEPFKLREAVGSDLLVFDPADDGIVAYGNILATSQKWLQANRGSVRSFRDAYVASWKKALSSPSLAAGEVSKYYSVRLDILEGQIAKTLEFVNFGGSQPGKIDMAPGGRLESTIQLFQRANVIPSGVTLALIEKLVV